MALLFMDGFDAGDVNQKWSNPAPLTAAFNTSTRFGAGMRLYATSITTACKHTIPASATVIMGAAANRVGTIGGGAGDILSFYGDAGTTQHITVGYNDNGYAQLKRGSTVIATATSGNILTGEWNYWECSATIADSGGRAIVRINGSTVIDFTGDTKNAGTNTTIDAIGVFTVLGPNIGTWIDDVYVCNDQDTTANSFLGDVRVKALVPTGAGSDTNFTPSAGSNYTTVDELPYSSSDYVSASTSGARDLYVVEDLASAYTVLGVQNNVIAKKTDAGGTALKPAIKSGGSVYYGVPTIMTTSEKTLVDTRGVNPATSAAWTLADVNSLEAGMEIA